MLSAYIGLIQDGSIPPPDLDTVAQHLQRGTETTGKVAIVLGFLVIGAVALIAPIIYAARSQDFATV